MILIADSGSTKTDWRLVSDEGILESFTTSGINPALQSLDELKEDQIARLTPYSNFPVKRIDFYGAGCGQISAQAKIGLMLNEVFPLAQTDVASDLLGAARAIFDQRAGIACILGTGSNSGYYNGQQIVENVPSLGFLLGDEGGGSQIGKQLLIDYLRGDMPDHLSDLMNDKMGEDRATIYQRVYQRSFPNRFLASLVELVSKDYSRDTYFRAVVMKEFDRFFYNCIGKYEINKEVYVGFVGSLAFHFQDILRSVASNHGIEISGIVDKPIDALANQSFKVITK